MDINQPITKKMSNLGTYSSKKQSERGKRPRKKGLFKLKKSRNCTSKCPMFTICRFQILGKYLPEELKGKCALANAMSLPSKMQVSEKQQHRIVKFLYGGKNDLLELIREVASNMDLATDRNNPQDLERLQKSIGYSLEKEFGQKIEHTGELNQPVIINIIKPKIEEKETE